MTRQEHLLAIASEECVEVSKEIHKALRFGLEDHYPEHPLTNRQRIVTEIRDLIAVIEILEEEGIINLDGDATWDQGLQAKKEKIEKYLKYSQEVGTLTEAP